MSLPIELIDQNPWWRDAATIDEDRYIAAWKTSSISWNPQQQYAFNLDADLVYTIRGSRQVGKTTLMKLMVKELISSSDSSSGSSGDGRVDPRRLFYYTCDLVANPRELASTVSTYLDWLRSFTSEKAFVFLDEVSSVREWQKAIKYLADTGKLKGVTVFLTGSHTLDLKAMSETLPGRRGVDEGTLDKVLLPMKYSEYVGVLSKEVSREILALGLTSWERRRRIIDILSRGEIPVEFDRLSLFLKDLNGSLQDYLLTGGIPRVVDEYRKSGKISEGVYRTYVDVVRGDLVRWGKRENYLRQVLSRVIETLGSPVGWNTLKQNTDIASHNTVADYIDALKDSFILIYLHQFDISRRAPSYQKEKKIHFHDPFFFHAMRGWITGRDPYTESLEYLRSTENIGRLVEGVVTDHLIRLAFQLTGPKHLFEYENSLFFWRGKREREVDSVLKVNVATAYLPIEVKYQRSIRKSDLYGVIDFGKGAGSKAGLILSKDTLQIKDGIIVMPLPLFLMLI